MYNPINQPGSKEEKAGRPETEDNLKPGLWAATKVSPEVAELSKWGLGDMGGEKEAAALWWKWWTVVSAYSQEPGRAVPSVTQKPENNHPPLTRVGQPAQAMSEIGDIWGKSGAQRAPKPPCSPGARPRGKELQGSLPRARESQDCCRGERDTEMSQVGNSTSHNELRVKAIKAGEERGAQDQDCLPGATAVLGEVGRKEESIRRISADGLSEWKMSVSYFMENVVKFQVR